MPAIVRDFDPRTLGRLNAVEALGIVDLDFLSVYNNLGHAISQALMVRMRRRPPRRLHGTELRHALAIVERLHRLHGAIARRVRALDVVLELAVELANCILDRPGSAIRQAANRRTRHDADRIANLEQQLEIFQAAFDPLDALEHFDRPASSLAARRALAAALVSEKTAAIVQEVDNANRLVEHDYRRRSQPQTADLAL